MKQDTETRNLFLKQCMDRIQKMKEYRNQYTALMVILSVRCRQDCYIVGTS